jgi:hypothetical protein
MHRHLSNATCPALVHAGFLQLTVFCWLFWSPDSVKGSLTGYARSARKKGALGKLQKGAKRGKRRLSLGLEPRTSPKFTIK